MKVYRVAGVVFGVDNKYAYTENICRDYLYEGDEKPVFTARIPDDVIAKTQSQIPGCSAGYAESLEVFRKICEYVLDKGEGIIFHCSAIAVDGAAYLFTAPSGTGKSTHTRFWRELLRDKAVMVNDDKPIIKYEDGGFYVYGTPWMGKHRLGKNIRVKIKAICKLERGDKNEMQRIGVPEMLVTIFNQTIRPKDAEGMDKLLKLIDELLNTVEIYRLKCLPNIDAAKLAYGVLCEGEGKI